MTKLIKKTDNPLYFFFKLFSVGFSTYAITGVSHTIYTDTNTYVAIAIALPFAWYYAFNWIGYFEAKEKIVPILLSGLLMMGFYTTWVPGLQKFYDAEALSVLSNNLDYTNLKEQHGRMGYDAEAYSRAVAKYSNIKNTGKTFKENKKLWVEEKVVDLVSTRFKSDNKTKTLTYKSSVADAISFRNRNSHLDLPKNLRTPNDIAVILYEKDLKDLKDPEAVTALKADAELLHFDYLKEKRDELKADYVTYENKALENSWTKNQILTMVLVTGFFVEIFLNALSLWRKLLSRGKKEEVVINTMLTLLNKTSIMDKLKTLNIVYDSGKNAGKVEAIYATMINIIVLYHERKKVEFKRYKEITNSDISDFKYLDVEARRYIRSAFDLLEGKNPQTISMEEIEEIIKNHKNP